MTNNPQSPTSDVPDVCSGCGKPLRRDTLGNAFCCITTSDVPDVEIIEVLALATLKTGCRTFTRGDINMIATATLTALREHYNVTITRKDKI